MKKPFLSLIMLCLFCIRLLAAAGAAAEAEAVTTVIVPAAEEKTAQVYYAGAEKAEAEEKTGEEAGVTFHPYVFEVDGDSQVKASVQLEPGLMQTSRGQARAEMAGGNSTVVEPQLTDDELEALKPTGFKVQTGSINATTVNCVLVWDNQATVDHYRYNSAVLINGIKYKLHDEKDIFAESFGFDALETYHNDTVTNKFTEHRIHILQDGEKQLDSENSAYANGVYDGDVVLFTLNGVAGYYKQDTKKADAQYTVQLGSNENTTVSLTKPVINSAKVEIENNKIAVSTVTFVSGNPNVAAIETYAYTTNQSLAINDKPPVTIDGMSLYFRNSPDPIFTDNSDVTISTGSNGEKIITIKTALNCDSKPIPTVGEKLLIGVKELNNDINTSAGLSELKEVTVGGENATTQIPLDPQKTVITLDPEKPVFNWEQIKPEETVMYDGVTLIKDTDYTVVYGDNINAGEKAGSVTVIGTGSYCDNITKTFDILPQEMTADNTVVTLENNTYTHTGSEIEPKVVSVVCDEKMLKENVDYVVLYKNNIDVGTGKVWVKGEGNFGGTVEKLFTIEQAGLSHDELMAYIPSNLTIRTSGYNETVVKVDVSWKEQKDVTMYDLESSVLINETKVPLKNDVSSIALEGEGIPAHVAYQVANGTSTFKNYKLFVLKEDEAQTDSSGQIAYGVRDGDTVIFTLAAYIGSQMSPNAVVQYKVQLNVTGTVLDPAYTQVILNPQNATYTGEQITTGVTVICNDITLVQDTDYTVLWGENVNVGDGTVTVFGKGNYTGNITAAFGINPAPANSLEIKLEKTKYTYTGKAIKPKTTVKLGKTVLEEGRDYTVSYANNKKVGTARVKITGKGNFTGEAEKTFKIVKAKNKIIKMLSAKTVSYKKLSKKDQTVKVTYKLLEKAPTTFKLKSVPKKVKKYVKVDPKGKIILKKGMPKGTYAIKLKVSIKASKNCKAASYVRTVKITVK